MNDEEGWKPSADAASAADTTATRHAILCLAEGEIEWPFRRGQWILGLLLAYMMLSEGRGGQPENLYWPEPEM